MSELEVRIVTLDPMRVAVTFGFGTAPEHEAWERLVAWSEPKGFFEDRAAHRIFGFNNPDPSPGSPNYGYEFCMEVGPDVEADGEVQIEECKGGRYAVTRCRGVNNIGRTWKELVTWRESSAYKPASHQWLEEHLGPAQMTPENLELDLYLPIA